MTSFNANTSLMQNKNDTQSSGQKLLSPNIDFYMSSIDKDRIMNPISFSAEVRQFLIDEEVYLRKMFKEENYGCIIEVGCHTGHNALWISEYCEKFIGVDVNKSAIEYAKKQHIDNKNIEFICSPIENLMAVLNENSLYPKRKLVLFPFNLFGNFINIENLLAKFDEVGVDVALSNFNTCSSTTIGRYNYYLNCFRDSKIRVFDAEQGVLFKAGQQFQSIAYDLKYLQKVIHDMSDYHGVIIPFSIHGYLMTLTK